MPKPLPSLQGCGLGPTRLKEQTDLFIALLSSQKALILSAVAESTEIHIA